MTLTHQQLLSRLHELNIITPAGQLNKQLKAILRKHPDVHDAIVTATLFLPDNTTMRARLYAVRHGIVSQPVCEACGANVGFNDQTGRFNTFCPNTKGSTCVSSSDRVRKQQKNTLVSRYGVDNPSKDAAILQRRRDTVFDKYGGSSPMAAEEVRLKYRSTMQMRHGALNPSGVPHFLDKRAATNNTRYGATTYAGGEVPPSAIESLQDREFCEATIQDFTVDEMAAMLKVSTHTVRRYLRGHQIDASVVTRNCTSPERDIMRFLESLGVEYQYSDRTIIPPRHVDFVVPSHSLAIEYDGIFYHSELTGRTRNYHRDKMISCANAGYRLIHIFSSEWMDKRHIVLSRIRNALGAADVVYARRCSVRSLSLLEAQVFFDTTHIQGFAAGAVYLGLEHAGKVVAAMSFCKSRFNKSYEWELLRFSSQLNTRVVGGASKLFSYFVKTHSPASVVSYCDLRWGSGALYRALGFKELRTSPPNYFYFKRNGPTERLLSRQSFQKHKLQSKLDTFDPELTEWENMQANGYDRIWDCGNGVWGWTPHT